MWFPHMYVVVALLVVAAYIGLFRSIQLEWKRIIGGHKRILIVIAHPDDESMFFIPLIKTLVAQKHQVFLLCLSTGNADGLGALRKRELYKAANVLGIEEDYVAIIEHKDLQDGLDNVWDVNIISQLVASVVRQRSIDMIFTFDEGGVSHHPNHIAVYLGLRRALKRLQNSHVITTSDLRSSNQPHLLAFALDSTSVLRKYSGIFDSVVSFGNRRVVFSFDLKLNYQAMTAHYSQFVWYRHLFVVFSRYSYMNTFSPITPET